MSTQLGRPEAQPTLRHGEVLPEAYCVEMGYPGDDAPGIHECSNCGAYTLGSPIAENPKSRSYPLRLAEDHSCDQAFPEA